MTMPKQDMKKIFLIPLTQGYFTKVDADDYEKFAIYRWCAAVEGRSTNTPKVRAMRGIYLNKKTIITPLARAIMNAPKGKYVDHINGDTLDNRKCNLRICTQVENGINRGKQKNNKSGFKGVHWHKSSKRWIAQIATTVKGKKKTHYLGTFSIKEEAAKAYDKRAKELFGEVALLNENLS